MKSFRRRCFPPSLLSAVAAFRRRCFPPSLLSAVAFFFGLALFFPLSSSVASPAASAADHSPAASIPFDVNAQGHDILSMTQDPCGDLWVSNEDDKGVWRYNPATSAWTNFPLSPDLPSNVYALAADRLGRIWAGLQASGVSVFNGRSWKNYGALNGPLGSHIFAITISPVDGDVWIASDGGIARYSLHHDSWVYYTRADGLISDQVSCLAFAKNGDLYAGTQCDGLMVARAGDGYRRWRTVSGWDPMPLSPAGAGLPSKLINAVLVSRAGDIYVGTTHGLAHSVDAGKTWRYLRGEDWQQQGNGLYHAAKTIPTSTTRTLLLEEYVTCLAEDGSGNLYIGYRNRGYEIDAPSGQRLYPLSTDKPSQGFVTEILPRNGSVLLGLYGGGVKEEQPLTDVLPSKTALLNPSSPAPPFPVSAKPPSVAALQIMLKQVKALKPAPRLTGAYLGDDWQTQGDAIGHYGRQYANFFAMQAPWGDHVPSKAFGYTAHPEMGPHHAPYDTLRHWVSWVRSDDRRALYDPVIGYRRQAEDDDHGESVQGRGYGGPDIWVSVTVAAGMQRVSLYFMNKDGHEGGNKNRDYLIELKAAADTLDKADAEPTLARARVRDFWGGVYQSFLVRGPGKYYLKIGKNNSMNTIVSAVLIDKVQGPMGEFEDMQTTWLGEVRDDPPNPDAPASAVTPVPSPPLSPAVKAARALWGALNNAYDKSNGVALERPYRLLAYRAAAEGGGSAALLANWRWKLGLWTPDDKTQFADTMAKAYQSLITLHPVFKTMKH